MRKDLLSKTLVMGIVVLFIGVGVAGSSPSLSMSESQKFKIEGNTLYVGGSGTGNYTRIQDAIDNASDGDTVFVFDDSSPYYENLVVYRSIDLVGEDRDSTVIDGDGIDSVIEVSADHVCIEGFTITNCKKDLSDAGINIFSDWNTIKNNNIMENQLTGIRLSSSHYNLIEKNFLKDNIWYHIYLKDESNNNTIQNNTLTESDDSVKLCNGIWLTESSDNLILNNEITGLKFTVGISLGTSSYNVVNKNRIHNNPCDDEANNIQISDHSDFNLIIDNEIKSNNGSGIMMLFSQGNEIIGNTIEFLPLQGIALGDCRYNNIIKLNNISFTEKGIGIGMYSSKNIVESNNLTNNTYGIYLSGTDLLGFVPNNVISKNNIVENEYGIYITISKFYGYSNDSLIYHNNFIDNTQNAYDICNNSWDNNGFPSGGNFWDDYNGTDDDGDGIGDTPYPIPGGDNEDKYPLMEPWSSENQPPSAPYIDGPTEGKPGVDYNYTFVTTDPDGDYVWYYIDWGDETNTGWIGPYNSGVTITKSHKWTNQGTFTIKAKAKDPYNDEGLWGELQVTMPRNKAINNVLFLRFLEQFPLLREVLLRLIPR